MPSSGSAIQLYKIGLVKFSSIVKIGFEFFPGVGGWLEELRLRLLSPAGA